MPINAAAEEVTRYFETNSTHPRLPSSPWVADANCLHLPSLPPHTPRQRRWIDPRLRWRSNDHAAGLDRLFETGELAAKPLALPAAQSPRRPAGTQRRV